MKKLTRKNFIIIALAITLIAGISIFLKIYNEKKYIKEVKSAVAEMLITSSLSETITEFYGTVWKNAIFSEGAYHNSESPYYRKDFNEALAVAQVEMEDNIKILNSGKSKIETSLRKLNSYPQKYKELHNSILKLYGYASEYISLGISPSGSFQTFAEKRRELSSEIMKLSSEINIQLPK
jgi:hypothetical protein